MDKKDKQLHMRLTAREATALDQLAMRKGLSRSEWIRRYLHAQARKENMPI